MKMKMRIKTKTMQTVGLICILSVSPYLTSCVAVFAAGAGVGAGTIAYVEGASVENVSANLKSTYQASLEAIKVSGYVLTVHTLSAHSALIYANTKTLSSITNSPTSIRIDLTELTPEATKISVRFGVFGDQDASHALLMSIAKHL